MLYTLSSSLHQEAITLPHPPTEEWTAEHQVVAVLTGGTEAQFVQLVKQGRIRLTEPIYILATGQSNSLAASMEILSYINQHQGHGEIRTDW